MTPGSLGLRSSGSYGSLQQVQNVSLPFPVQITPPISVRKPPKMLKEKESLFHWIYKFTRRRKGGMLFLCLISAVFLLVLSSGKGEVGNLKIQSQQIVERVVIGDEQNIVEKMSYIQSEEGQVVMNDNSSKNIRGQETVNESLPPPQPVQKIVNVSPPSLDHDYNHGYVLPPGNPCEHFTLPPPPADKKRTGPRPCPVCYLPLNDSIAHIPEAPSFSPVLKRLEYIHEENLTKSGFGGSEFGGYPSLKQRDESYDIKESMTVYCGFVKGDRPGRRSGFDIDETDLLEMDSIQGLVVVSAIFGAFDYIRQPQNISEYSKQNVSFYMFVDEETEAFLRKRNELGSDRKVGLWRIVVVKNLPSSDARRNGKVPKLLPHRLFPKTRYSIWIDAKLQLVVDPIQVLERFLLRHNASFAISKHYRRFDVFVEAEANKAANKYNNASIDFQVNFYKEEGLTPYSEKKLPIISDVPEGCVIIREHTPISNLYACNWYNEVELFTPRDQISFSTVRDKIHSKTNFTVYMFLDCERRNFVWQGYHRGTKEELSPPPPGVAVHPPPLPPPTPMNEKTVHISPVKNIPSRRGRERRSRRHRKIVTDSTEANTNSNFV